MYCDHERVANQVLFVSRCLAEVPFYSSAENIINMYLALVFIVARIYLDRVLRGICKVNLSPL